MPLFDYKAIDENGKQHKGTIDAPSQEAIKEMLQAQGLVLTDFKPSKKKTVTEGQGKKKGDIQISLGPAKIKNKDLTVITRQLAILLTAGLPLIRALRTLERQTKNPNAKKVLGETANSIEGGSTFSEALAQHPRSFNDLYQNMIKAGEASGALEIILDRLATFMEKATRIIKKVKSAMVYPIVVLTFAIAITAGLMIFIVPKFKKIFQELLEGEPLPGFTEFVMNISDNLKNNFIGIIIGIAVFIFGIILLNKTKPGHKMLDWIKFNVPAVGAIISRSAIAKFSRTLSTLLSSGVPMLSALLIVRDTSGNVVVSDAVQKVHDAVKEGEGISNPLGLTKVFPPMVVSMIEVGEETGKLPEMLEQVADVYEEEVDNAVSALTSLIEPFMIMFLAIVVGSIVIAMFLPLIKIIEKLS